MCVILQKTEALYLPKQYGDVYVGGLLCKIADNGRVNVIQSKTAYKFIYLSKKLRLLLVSITLSCLYKISMKYLVSLLLLLCYKSWKRTDFLPPPHLICSENSRESST